MQIHLITFDIPFPADYGGVIDVFYKLRTLHEKGFQVILHCFQYGKRQPSHELERLATKVYYYERRLSLKAFFSPTPFIVATRNNKALIDNILQDNFPIIFEGVHTTFFINHPKLIGRRKIVRMHNIEFQYYAHLTTMEKNIFKKLFFWTESQKLKKHERALAQNHDINFWAISEKDLSLYQNLGAKHIEYCPAFHPFSKVNSKEGKGNYVIFHGNLNIKDNELAALLLIEHIFSKNDYQLIIAGKNPTKKLIDSALPFSNISVISNPDEAQMTQLIEQAHIHLLWSFQPEGVKLKLFYALFQGRFIIINENVAGNLALNDCVTQVETIQEANAIINNLFSKTFDNQEIIKRNLLVSKWKSTQESLLLNIFKTN